MECSFLILIRSEKKKKEEEEEEILFIYIVLIEFIYIILIELILICKLYGIKSKYSNDPNESYVLWCNFVQPAPGDMEHWDAENLQSTY